MSAGSRRARDAPASYSEEPWKEEPAMKRSKRAANPLRGRPTLTMVFEHDVRTRPLPPPCGPTPRADIGRFACPAGLLRPRHGQHTGGSAPGGSGQNQRHPQGHRSVSTRQMHAPCPRPRTAAPCASLARAAWTASSSRPTSRPPTRLRSAVATRTGSSRRCTRCAMAMSRAPTRSHAHSRRCWSSASSRRTSRSA